MQQSASTDAAETSDQEIHPLDGDRLLQVIEALLFIGAQPVTFELFSSADPNLNRLAFERAIRVLRDRYRRQRRPVKLLSSTAGYSLVLAEPFRRELAERRGGPRPIRLNRATIDVLSVIAYRQPIPKPGIDELVGFDAGPAVRQLIRRGLVAVEDESTGPDAKRLVTAPRFLEHFGLESLDDVPSSDDLDRL